MAVPPRPGTDWTDDEHAEIRRLEKACHASKDWSLECSHTDVRDPWCIVYDQHHQAIIVHIARIDRQYVVVWPREQRSKKTAIMAVASTSLLKGYRHTSAARVDRIRRPASDAPRLGMRVH